ncbi:hypothetical protein GCM10010921_19480 [Microbacterium album]|uniref:Uncharacterized protein n=2 Tax=Microbacterium album TaxID=2053191 RepID=A0A917MP17_9MICO|nr:hypothetical protein GCM10010921_19480 [Microbacterium album]
MRENRQWRPCAPPAYAVIVLVALALVPAWITIPSAVSLTVLYLMFSPVMPVPSRRS